MAELAGLDLAGLDGFHVHALCQQGAEAFEGLVEAVIQRFRPRFDSIRWINLGGGHHFTRPQYDLARLARAVARLREVFSGEIFVEPGEAVALNAGVLVARVLDIVVHQQTATAILDASAVAHLPDVLEMPYRPEVRGGHLPGQEAHTYRLAGSTCMAGDIVGTYSYARPLSVGDRLVFLDMAHYTMVKTNFFNGVGHPVLAVWHSQDRRLQLLREFGYADYEQRLS